jgi:hypothetical protein
MLGAISPDHTHVRMTGEDYRRYYGGGDDDEDEDGEGN